MAKLEFDGVCWEVRLFDRTFINRAYELIDIINQYRTDDNPICQEWLDFNYHEGPDGFIISDEACGKFNPVSDGIEMLLLFLALYNDFNDTENGLSLAYENDSRGNEFSTKIEDHEPYLTDIGYKLDDLRPLCEAVGLMLPAFPFMGQVGSVDF